MKILTKDGSPFKTRQAAAIFAGRLKLEKGKFEIVPEETGYAIDSQVEPRPIEGAKKPEVPEETKPEENPVKKHKVTTPWKPATLLDIPERLKDPNYVYRFCDTKRDGNIQKKAAEGWEIDKELSRKMKQAQPSIEDGSNLDGTTRIRELVVMKMKKEIAESRRKYYSDMAGKAVQNSAKELKAELGDAEYGDIKVQTF